MSRPEQQQGSRDLRREIRRIELLSWIPGFAMTLGYVAFLLSPSSEEMVTLIVCLVGSSAVGLLACEGFRSRAFSPIVRKLDRESSDSPPATNAGNDLAAIGALSSLPMVIQKARLLAGLASVVLIPPLMWVMGFDAWIGAQQIQSLTIVSLVGSLLTANLAFYWVKRSTSILQVEFATSVSDPAHRTDLVVKHSLSRRLAFTIAIPALASILLVTDVVHVSLRSSSERQAIEWAGIVVQALAEADPRLSFEERVKLQLPNEKFWPLPFKVVEVRPGHIGDSSVSRPLSAAFLDALDRARAHRGIKGAVVPAGGLELGAFKQLGNGNIIVAKVLRSDLVSPMAGFGWIVGLTVFVTLLITTSVVRLAAADVHRGFAALQEGAERLARRDLAHPVSYESEDELGELGRALDRVGLSRRTTLARLSETIDCVGRISTIVSTVIADVAAASAQQSDQIQHARQVMEAIGSGVGDVSRSAQELTGVIDESSNSVLELGAAGDELNETAEVLTTKVDAVSDSLEKMVRSAKKIAGTTDKLAAASEETSSSMEEMASAMRAVDTSAETTANLSRDVVSKAELGQAKVVQTIAGMEAIREATDVAESVIRGLGARTNEIGGILDVIDDVADETNLLALNAAIIAAQAGEQGKAFSVVADEIKELADRVLASTKEIGSLIRAVQHESENAIGAIEAGSASVMSGVDLSAEAGRTLEEITVASRESGTRIGEIVASVREQTKAASHVVALMERVRDSAEEISAAGADQDRGNEIVYGSAETMREVAQQVRHTTEDQARAFGHIRQNVNDVRDAVVHIATNLGTQSDACSEVTQFLGQVLQGASSNEEAAEKMRDAMRELVSQSEILRAEADSFRV